MGSINLSIHPLTFAFGLYYALTGRIFRFVICTISALIHELGHSFSASKLGYKLNKITLMPYGAVVTGNIDALNSRDEIKIALAGPLINLSRGLFFLALWWVFPETYAFTDIVAEINFSLAIVNFLPIFPLDGGRVLSASLKGALGSEKAIKISKAIGLTFSVVLLCLFIASIFFQINISLLFFSLFVLFGALSNNKENKYIMLYSVLSKEKLLMGLPYKKHALHKNATVKRLLSILDESSINEVAVFDGDKVIATLSQQKIGKILENGDFYARIDKYL